MPRDEQDEGPSAEEREAWAAMTLAEKREAMGGPNGGDDDDD